jgi:hypothetical protein
MKNVFGLVVLSLNLAACAVEQGPESEQTAAATTSALTEQASRSADRGDADSPTLTSCSFVWECESCGVGLTANVLYQICGDGSMTLVDPGTCGQPCF